MQISRTEEALITRRSSPVGCLLFALALPAALVPGTSLGQNRSPDPDEVAGLVVRLTNEFRAQERRGKVALNPRLTEPALYFAGYLGKTGRFGHEADGSTPDARARRHGYDYCIVSENIAYEYSSTGFTARELAERFVAGWKKSPGHRRNMLDPDVTETGAAVARGDRPGHYYAVQMFGRPAAQATRFSIANRSNAAVNYRLGGSVFALAPRQTRTHQQCRSEELKIAWAGRRQETSLTPRNGARLAIVRSDSGGLSLKIE
ncbi:MAG TPA: CAP domain-containing protein [Burkholderiales bacterium]|nr:CAP domain-containing protein [Burkholderiales bacterium]